VSPVAPAATPIPEAIRVLLDASNFVHLSTLRKDQSSRNWIVWSARGRPDPRLRGDLQAKAADMRRDPRVGLSVADSANPYRMAVLQGRVVRDAARSRLRLH
jgi:hypothetical protein